MHTTENILNSAAVTRLVTRRFLPSLIIPCFTDTPLSTWSTEFERKILESINRHQTKLKFFRTEALRKNEEFLMLDKITVYRLNSARHCAWADFVIQEHDGDKFANVMMLTVLPMCQGNGFAFKNFLLNYLALTLFEAGVCALIGTASENSTPVRNPRHDFRREKTKDGIPKLVRLYELLGCERMRFNSIILTREAWEAARMPRKRFRLTPEALELAG